MLRALATCLLLALFFGFFGLATQHRAFAQGLGSPAAPAAAPVPVATLLQPALAELRAAVAGLRTAKWKAPGPVKEEADANCGSITRDLDGTLPALVAQADGGAVSVANSFAVYRNLDALYEVLLRVVGTADLAAPEGEASTLAHALGTLDAARRSLGETILATSQANEAALARQRQAQAAAAVVSTAGSSPPVSSVVADGPAAPATHHKVKSKPKSPAPQ